MGNCQAIDAAALVIQHPSGKIERLYWPILASEIMRMNPGHYVSLIIPLPVSAEDNNNNNQHNNNTAAAPAATTVQFTRVKLLRPTDTLALGHAYRLVTTQEVMKVLRAKKYAKMKRQQQQHPESVDKSQILALEKESSCEAGKKTETEKDKEKDHRTTKQERHRPRTPSINSTAMRSKSWRPTLRSISEAAS
ncbi:uncharacterized protein LOC8281926 [Ricinus communis]|uniref:uncharacterized protein LOC8281926 n=1 Tax=Ricinus communis TaxID=3988 RepID=UPI00201AA25E|nr:uncharacterized protein LOC8281926 [Ricinus communis]